MLFVNAIYFSWSLIQALAQPVQLFWPLVTFGVASSNSLTDSDLQLLIETEQDLTRHSFIQLFWRQKMSNPKHIKHSFVIFGTKILLEKYVRKTLMKLTLVWQNDMTNVKILLMVDIEGLEWIGLWNPFKGVERGLRIKNTLELNIFTCVNSILKFNKT